MLIWAGSICTINGYLMVYPQTADVKRHYKDDDVKVLGLRDEQRQKQWMIIVSL
jgi:outer membrane lipopolysaccharide assembly protein LptE/RlpB